MKKLKKVTLILIFTLALTLTLVMPAIAAPKLTYSIGVIDYPDPENPGMVFNTDDLEHGRDVGRAGISVGAPWGTGTFTQTMNYQLNTTSLTGNGISAYTEVSATGQVEVVRPQ